MKLTVLTSLVTTLVSATTTSSAFRRSRCLGCRSFGRSIALGRSSRSLVDNLHRWLGFLVGVFIVIVSCGQFSSAACSVRGLESSYREARKGSRKREVSPWIQSNQLKVQQHLRVISRRPGEVCAMVWGWYLPSTQQPTYFDAPPKKALAIERTIRRVCC